MYVFLMFQKFKIQGVASECFMFPEIQKLKVPMFEHFRVWIAVAALASFVNINRKSKGGSVLEVLRMISCFTEISLMEMNEIMEFNELQRTYSGWKLVGG